MDSDKQVRSNGEMNIISKKLKKLGEKSATVSLNPLQISHTICWVQTQDSNKPQCKPLRLLICECFGFYHYTGQHIINSMWPIIQQITQNEHQSTTELDYIAMYNQVSSLKWK